MARLGRHVELRLLGRPLLSVFALLLGGLLALLLLLTSGAPRPIAYQLVPGVQRRAEAELELTESGRLEGAAEGQLLVERTPDADRLLIPLIDRLKLALDELQVELLFPGHISSQSLGQRSELIVSPLTETNLEATPEGLRLTLRGLSERSVASLRLELPPGTIAKNSTERFREFVVVAILALAILWPVFTLLLALRLVSRRRWSSSRIRSSLPSELSPAEVGILVNEVASSRLLLATLLDLCERGAVTLKGDNGSFRIIPERSTLLLRDFEQVLVDRLTRLHHPERTLPIQMFERQISLVYLLIYDRAARLGVFVENPRELTRRFQTQGVLGFLFGLVLILISLSRPELVSLRFLGLSGLVTSLLVLALLPARSLLTRKGEAMRGEWLEFRNFLVNPPRKLELATWYHFLPYAIVLGVEAEWQKAAERLRFRLPAFVLPEHRGTIVGLRDFSREVLLPLGSLVKRLASSRDPAL